MITEARKYDLRFSWSLSFASRSNRRIKGPMRQPHLHRRRLSATALGLTGLQRLSSLHAAGAYSQSGAEPDGGTLRVRVGESSRRADALLYPAASLGGTGREGRGDEEDRRGEGSEPGARPGSRGEGREYAG